MSKTIQCPACLNAHATSATGQHIGSHDIWLVDCEACGQFRITDEARDDFLSSNDPRATPLKRAALSHAIRMQQNQKPPVLIQSKWLKRFLKEVVRLPTPAEQAANIIALIGDDVREGLIKRQKPLVPWPIGVFGAQGVIFCPSCDRLAVLWRFLGARLLWIRPQQAGGGRRKDWRARRRRTFGSCFSPARDNGPWRSQTRA